MYLTFFYLAVILFDQAYDLIIGKDGLDMGENTTTILFIWIIQISFMVVSYKLEDCLFGMFWLWIIIGITAA